MALDRNHAANFVGVAIAALKEELSATNQRTERLTAAVSHAATARTRAAAVLAQTQAMRAQRLEQATARLAKHESGA
ncbi:MAG: hypothetical protein EA355_07315 [Rhodobacteraceae bacterium]|nr:MAG: hypothetical protein EA355_07315 [Paracoccaceae bacterium]